MSDYFDSSISSIPRPILSESGQPEFWRKEPPVFDANRQGVKGGMFEHQLKWWNLKNFIKILVGGFGSGKTHGGAKRIIALALLNAPVPVAAVSPTFPMARETVISTIYEQLAGKQTLLGRAFSFTYNQQSHTFRIRYKGKVARIIVYSGEDPLSLRGPNLGAAWIDEPFIQDEEVFKQMIARVRHPQAVHMEIAITGTPEQLNWGYDLCVGKYKTKHDVGFIQASTRANKALDPEYVTRLMGAYSGKAADAYIDGAFVNLGAGLVYYAFSPLDAGNVRTLEIPESAELGCGMDFNVNPMAFMLFWKHQRHMHYFAEFELDNADTEYACGVLREKFVVPATRMFKKHELRTIYPDATGGHRHSSSPQGKTDFWYIRNAGFEIDAAASNPKHRDRENSVNGKLKPKDGPITVTIDPSCHNLIKYLSLYSHPLRHKQKNMSHLLDAFGYPIYRLFPINKDEVVQMRLSGH